MRDYRSRFLFVLNYGYLAVATLIIFLLYADGGLGEAGPGVGLLTFVGDFT